MKLIINTFDNLKRRLASAVTMLAIAFASYLHGIVTVVSKFAKNLLF